MLICVSVGSCLFGGNLPTGITSFQQDGRYGSWRIPFTTFRRLQYRSHLDYDHRMSWIRCAPLQTRERYASTEPLMLVMLSKSATTPTQTHLHGGGHNRLTGTITPDTVCAHHSTFPPISHDHRPNRNIYRLSSYPVRRQSSMASESMQAQLP